MKKILFLLILLSSLTPSLKADYTPLKLYEMIFMADKIVVGQITRIDSTIFEFSIDQSPSSDSGTISIQRFYDWSCASRWADYSVGQSLLIFLVERNGQFHALSAGNEGELPVRNDSVFINGFSLPSPPPDFVKQSSGYISFKSIHHLIDHEEYYGYKVSLADMLESIQLIRSCFDFKRGNYKTPDAWTIKCSEGLIKKAADYNKIIRWAYHLAKKANDNK